MDPINIDEDPYDADWPKQTLDLDPDVHDLPSLKQFLERIGVTITEFKETPAYLMALTSGNYPWLGAL